MDGPENKNTFINHSEDSMSSPSISFRLAPAVAGLLLLASSLAPANTPAAGLSDSESRVFRFNVSPSGYPPYLICGDNGTAGIMWEVVETIAEHIGYRVEPVKVPRKRVDQLLLEGLFDGTPRAREWTDNPDEFIFTDPVVDIEEVIFFPKDSAAKFRVVEDLFSLTLVTRLGYYFPALEPHFRSGRIERFNVPRDQDIFIYLLNNDELDAAIADRLVGQWLLMEQGIQDEFRVSSSILSQSGFRLMLRPGWQEFARAFNEKLAAMRAEGEIDAILSKYR